MNKNSLTLTTLIQGSSLNYGEGFGNTAVLKKLTKADGLEYVYVSRQALRYSLVETMRIDFTTLEKIGSGNKAVIQFSKEATIKDYPELDLFGYMKTEKGSSGMKRSAVARLSPAVAVTPFQDDLDFLSNIGLSTRLSEQLQEDIYPNLSSSEIQDTYYVYTLTVDLDRVGIDGEIELPVEERVRRVCQLLDGVEWLYRDIKGRREDLSPVFVVGGVYTRKNPFFANAVVFDPLTNEIAYDPLSDALDNAQLFGKTFMGAKKGVQLAGQSIGSVHTVFESLKDQVRDAYAGD